MASNVDQLASSIVRLKVGERTFDTRRSTLLNSGSPILARLIGGDDEGLRGADNDGDRIFVDGDGDGFAILLRALRSTRIDAVPERDRPQLALEAEISTRSRGSGPHSTRRIATRHWRRRTFTRTTSRPKTSPSATAPRTSAWR